MVKEVSRSHIDDYLLGNDFSFELTQLESTGKLLLSNWEGNRQESQGSPNGGKRLQVPDIFISLKGQEETNEQ